MTFNIQGSQYSPEGPNAWVNRAGLNVATIRKYAPDLIGFQETQSDNLATYQMGLSDYAHVVGNNYGDDPPDAWTSIFWKAERFALVEAGEFWFSQTPDVPSSDWGVPYPMGATWVRLRDHGSGAELLHLNTHFEDGPEGEQSRQEGSRLIITRLNQFQAAGLPALVTGDFNCNPGAPAHRAFLAAGFVDTYLAVGRVDGAESSYHGFEGERYSAEAASAGANTFWRIDWILARGGRESWQITSCAILRDAQPPTYPSDHYPVLAEVELR
jgi:endonuclease/exonuclease/phosphatase family metal-dependent hydrolase